MAADLVITNARIRTMDPARPLAGALASIAGRIVAVGGDDELALAVGPHTRVMDLGGMTVVPGLIDTHLHLAKLGLDLAKVLPTHPLSADSLLSLIAQAQAVGEGWLWVFGEDHAWELDDVGGQLPDARALDSVAPSRPVICHCGPDEASINSVAHNVLADRWDVLRPHAEMGPDGEFTGRLRGAGVLGLLKQLEPPPTSRQLKAAVERAMCRLSQSGITSVLDCGRAGGYVEDLRAVAAVMNGARLPVRVTAMMRPEPNHLGRDVDNLAQWPLLTGQYLASGWVKAFADGEIKDAFMITDYPGRPGYRGAQRLDEDVLTHVTVRTLTAGWRICVHASGDAATSLVLRAYSRAAAELGPRWHRGSAAIAHGFLADVGTMRRCRELGITLFIQPALAFAFGDEMKETWGSDRAQGVNSYRTLLDAGIEVGAGSDIWPPDAGLGLWAATTRRTGRGTLGNDRECLSVGEALELFTVRGARAMGRPDLGALIPGHRCDLAVFVRDPVHDSAEDLRHLQPVLTMVGGEVTWQA